jgi:hypothetical protein
MLKSHASQHFSSRSADVDVLAAVAGSRCTFDDRRREPTSLQPKGEGGASDSGATDEHRSCDAVSHAHWLPHPEGGAVVTERKLQLAAEADVVCAADALAAG